MTTDDDGAPTESDRKARAIRAAGDYLQTLVPDLGADKIQAVSAGLMNGEWIVTTVYESQEGERKFAVMGIENGTARTVCYLPESLGKS